MTAQADNRKKKSYSGATKSSSQRNKTKTTSSKKIDARTQEDRRSTGVAIMLGGLLLALWFLVIYAKVLGAGGSFLQICSGILAAVGNLALALFIVYGGFALYRERKPRLRFWQIWGWCIFSLGVLALLEQNISATTFQEAVKASFAGAGGGPFGLLPGYLAGKLPTPAATGVVLWAFVILGLLLGSDFKVLHIFSWSGHKIQEYAQRPRPVREYEEDDDVIEETPLRAKQSVDGNRRKTKLEQLTELEEQEAAKAAKEATFVKPPLVIHYDDKPNLHTIGEAEDLSAITVEEAQQLAKAREGEDSPFVREKMVKVGNEKEDMAVIPHHKLTTVQPMEPVQTAEEEEASAALAATAWGAEPPKRRLPPVEVKEQPILPTQPAIEPINSGEYPQEYQLPPITLLKAGTKKKGTRVDQEIMDNSTLLEQTLASFGVKAQVMQVVSGPAVTRYELQPAPGVRVAKIANLADDIALALAAKGVRIEAPVPGKAVVGIEIPKAEVTPVMFRDVIETETFQNSKALLSVALGLDITGTTVVADLAQMPHLLVAGATGSGKSVCINGLICSILFKATPQQVKLVMIDPKKVELSSYSGLPHLARPVVSNAKKASKVLKEMVAEMERRYTLFSTCGVRNFAQYNESDPPEKLPQIVVIIDELADLMMVAAKEVEDSICRLAQMARAAGIHLVIATQRPSVDVITGLIKANVPSRIAFHVSSYVDSRTILDASGAEQLLGKGDMLFHPVGMSKPLRVQGAYISEAEIESLVDWCSKQAAQEFIDLPEAEEDTPEPGNEDTGLDELFHDAAQQVILSGQASASFLQRRFRIGYNRAARLVESLEQMGIVGPLEGNKRQVLMNMEDFTLLFGSGN